MKFYLSLFLRRLPYFLLLLAVGSALGLTLSSVLPPVYVAEAHLLVESEQIPDSMAASTVRTEATEQLQIIQQRIMTRANLLELANRLKVYVAQPGKPAATMTADDIVDDMRKRAKMVTTGGTVARGPAQATLVSVSFEAPDSAMAALVANELVTLILQENVALRTTVSGQTLDFFTQEVTRLDKDLTEKRGVILAFKQKNQDALPDSLDFRRNQQATLQAQLQQMLRDEATLKDQRNKLVKMHDIAGGDAAPVNLTPEQQQLKTLQDQLAQALTVYSAENPRVKVLQTQVTGLQGTVAKQLAAAATAAGGKALTAYDVQLADIDGQLTYIADQKVQIATQVDALRVTLEATPGNAIALDALQRDYDAISTQYDTSVQRKAQAETGDLIEAMSKGQRISVVEQAVAPRDPARPNRVLIAGGGVGGGLALGLGLVALLEALNRAIRRPVDLTARLGITPFATMPYMRTRGEILRRRLIIALALLVVLVGIPAGIWAIDTYYMPMDMLMDAVVRKLGLNALIGQIRQGTGG